MSVKSGESYPREDSMDEYDVSDLGRHRDVPLSGFF